MIEQNNVNHYCTSSMMLSLIVLLIGDVGPRGGQVQRKQVNIGGQSQAIFTQLHQKSVKYANLVNQI